MQATEFVATIKWIDSVITAAMRDTLFSSRLLGSSVQEKVTKGAALQASHDWAKTIPIWSSNELAREVFSAFDLGILLNEQAPIDFAESMFAEDSSKRARLFYSDCVLPYRRLIALVEPMTKVLIPEELRGVDDNPDILSITLHKDGEVGLKALQQTFDHVQMLYSSFATLGGVSAVDLQIVSIQSGSPIGVNLKGSGDIIKQVRVFVLDIWNRIRFKEQDMQIANNNVLLSDLKVIGEIHKKVQSGALSPEEGEKLKRSITRSGIGLLNCHVLPTEVAKVELISNEKLLNGFNPKLLESSTSIATDATQTHPKKSRSGKKNTLGVAHAEPA